MENVICIEGIDKKKKKTEVVYNDMCLYKNKI